MSKTQLPAQGPVHRRVRPLAWADDKAMAGQVGNVASEAAKAYWERSDWVDRESAKRLRHPLFALGPGFEYVQITRDGDRFTIEIEGMAKADAYAMSHDPREMLLATLAEMLMGPNAELRGQPLAAGTI